MPVDPVTASGNARAEQTRQAQRAQNEQAAEQARQDREAQRARAQQQAAQGAVDVNA